jgi:hypothetical protein
MKRILMVALALAVVVGGVGFGGWTIFEHFDRAGKIKDAKKACTTLDLVTGNPTLPTGFTLPAGEKLLRVAAQGKTQVVFASLSGGRPEIVAARDSIVSELQGQGYTLSHRDQEPTYEADAALTKNGVQDSVNVRPLCSGRLVARYTLH